MKNKNDDCKCSGNSIVRSKGEYTIVVVRNGFRIKEDLPYCIWGTMYLNGQNFSTAINQYLPVGVTCSSVVSGENIIFTYTNGLVTDIIQVFAIPTALVSYPEMLANLNTNYMKTELVYFCNNTQVGNLPILTAEQNKILQGAPLYLQTLGSMGSKNNELITPLSRQMPNNSVKDVIEISMRKQDIKPQTVWVHKFAYVTLTERNTLVFYWQIIFNEIVNMNEERQSLDTMKEELK